MGQLKRQLARLDAEVAELEGELGRVEESKRQKRHVKDIEKIARAIARRIEQVTEAMTLDERKEMLRALVERIVVSESNELTIECGVPGLLNKATQATTSKKSPLAPQGAAVTSAPGALIEDLHEAPQASKCGRRSE